MGKAGVFKSINSQDKSITPFKVYKSWRYDTTSSLDSNNIDRIVAIKPNPNVFSGNKVTLDTWQREEDSGSLLVNLVNDKEASLQWYSLNHLYYKRAGQPYETFGYSDPNAIERTLFDEASVISIPQRKFGEAIKPNSVKLKLQNTQLNSISMSLIDDGHGNLVDTALSASISGELLYLGFNSSTYAKNYFTNLISLSSSFASASYITTQVNTRNLIDKIHVDTIYNDVIVTGKNVHIVSNTETYTNTISWGNSAFLSNKGYIRIRNRDEFNFKRTDDYAISFWINQFATSSLETYILSKKSTGIGNFKDRKTKAIITDDVEYSVTQFPFEIVYAKNTNNLTCRISTGAETSKVEYTNNVTGSANHIVFQKTGSLIELYVNSTKIDSTSIPKDGNFQNNADIFIGSYGIDSNKDGRNGIEATIDEFFIFNKALTQKEITQLAFTGSENSMITNTNNVGNVFYEHGIIVLSDPRPKYGTKQYKMFNDRVYNYISGNTEPGSLSNFYLEYNSTVTLYEHEYVCKLKEDEFNFTSNVTIRENNNENSEIPKSFVSNANFSPYITTVGLYDQYGQLLAVGKLGTPIKKRDNVDLAIIVKFDM